MRGDKAGNTVWNQFSKRLKCWAKMFILCSVGNRQQSWSFKYDPAIISLIYKDASGSFWRIDQNRKRREGREK